MSHKCIVVHKAFSPRFTAKSEAQKAADEIGGEICYCLYSANHLECSFGWGIVKNNEVIGLKETEYFKTSW